MAETFINNLTRAAGSVTSKTGSMVGAASTEITVSANTGIVVGNLIDHPNYIGGTKVAYIVGTTIKADRVSTNAGSLTGQTVKFLGVSTSYTSPSSVKSILIGGTFANNTTSRVELTVEVYDNSTSVGVGLASKIPVPAGSSFVISEAGKTVLEGNDEIRIYCNTANAIDANLSILKGVA